MQSNAIFGLAGIGFINQGTDTVIGYSVTATQLKISGGWEQKGQKTSTGLAVQSFHALGDISVEIEGITDATPGFAAALQGAELVAGSDAIPAALRPTAPLDPSWAGTMITVAAGRTPAPGAYTVEKQTNAVIRRLFVSDGFSGSEAGGAGEVATADFAVAGVPAALADGSIAVFFVEPAATGPVGEYVYGGTNLPPEMTVVAMTLDNRSAGPLGRNVQMVRIPRLQVNPIERTWQMDEVNVLGTLSGMALYDPSIAGNWAVRSTHGIT